MPHWLEKALEILLAPTADLRELAHLAGADPRTFYRGIRLSDVDVTGQDIEGMAFLDERFQEPDNSTRQSGRHGRPERPGDLGKSTKPAVDNKPGAIDRAGSGLNKLNLALIEARRVRRKKRNLGRAGSALSAVLESLNFSNLPNREKAELKKTLRVQRKELKRSIALIDRHLEKLAAKKMRKVGKRTTRVRP